MNTNEVIANLALEHLGLPKGRYDVVNPNDHVNKSQSTNDAYPTGLRIAVYRAVDGLMVELERLVLALGDKAEEFARRPEDGPHPAPGRRADDARAGVHRLRRRPRRGAAPACATPARCCSRSTSGATAIGTGLNTPEGYSAARGRPARRGHRAAGGGGREPHRGDLRRRRLRLDARRRQAHRRQAREDLQRPAAAVLRAAGRAERDQPARAARPDRRSCRRRSTRSSPRWSTRSASRSSATTSR